MYSKKWEKFFKNEEQKLYFQEIKQFIENEREEGKIIYPSDNLIFNSFHLCPLENIKVVILGNEPYHKNDSSNGMAFSVKENNCLTNSLYQILKVSESQDKTLKSWAEQGVFLLNLYLTVEKDKPLSHKYIGWEDFVLNAILTINNQCENVVFMLWGKEAQNYNLFINKKKHQVLYATYPGSFSSYKHRTKYGKTFMECNHFVQANHYLQQYGKYINW